jgi:hypothetical protein
LIGVEPSVDDIINMQVLHKYVQNIGVSAGNIQSNIIRQEMENRRNLVLKSRTGPINIKKQSEI